MRFLLILPVFALVAGLIWFFLFSNFSPFHQKALTPQSQNLLTKLQITEPKNGAVLTLANLKITGSAVPQTYLAAVSASDSKILKVASASEFATNLNLAEGYNLIKIVNFAPDESFEELDLEVFYLSSKFEELVEPAISTESTPTDETISHLTQLRKNQRLKIAAGVVKGILGKNLALETLAGTRTIVVSDMAKIGSFANFSKTLNLSQIQAADFVVALGSFSQQGILTAQLLLVAADGKPAFDKAVKFGIVNKVEKDTLELTNPQNGTKITISAKDAKIFDEQNQKVETEKLTIGNKLVVVGKFEKEVLKAEKILVAAGNFLQELEKFATPAPATESAR